MREIKFRAWDIEEKRMFHHFDLPDQYLIGLDATVWDTKKPDKFGLGLGDVVKDKFVLQQFTGLKDKNKTEIYEGDMIKWRFVNTGEDDPEYTEPVEWSECGFFLDGGAPLTVAMDDCEVIGNIYEHPELLKQ